MNITGNEHTGGEEGRRGGGEERRGGEERTDGPRVSSICKVLDIVL